MWQDFKDFISKGSVIDLAIGVIIGAAFTAIVNSLVDDMFMPIIGAIIGGIHIEGLAFTVGNATINYGSFLLAVINFILVAVILFFLIRGLAAANRELEEMGLMDEEEEEEKPPEPTLTLEEQLLSEIRDLLRENLNGEGNDLQSEVAD